MEYTLSVGLRRHYPAAAVQECFFVCTTAIYCRFPCRKEQIMSIRADYHLHSSFSGDSETPMEQMILKGIELGLTDMCFTEHMDINFPVSEIAAPHVYEVNTDSYLFDLIKYKEKYADKIQVHFGIELGVQSDITKECARYIKSHDFDFVIASSHVAEHLDPYLPAFYEGRTEEEAYRAYFNSILENIKGFTNFDIYGHLDYVVRYGENKDKYYTYERYQDILDKILDALIYNGKGIELNTGGIKYGVKDFHPCTDLLKRYREKGGEIITIGSDAHRPENLCDHFGRAEEVLKECGFRYYCVFDKRTPDFRKL